MPYNEQRLELIQQRFQTRTLSTWNQSTQEESVCRGMCMDWLRRILTNKNGGLGSKAQWHSAFGDMKNFTRRFEKQRRTHEIFVDSEKKLQPLRNKAREPGKERIMAEEGAPYVQRINSILSDANVGIQIQSLVDKQQLAQLDHKTDKKTHDAIIDVLNEFTDHLRNKIKRRIAINNFKSDTQFEQQSMSQFATDWKSTLKKQPKGLFGLQKYMDLGSLNIGPLKMKERSHNFDQIRVEAKMPAFNDEPFSGCDVWNDYVASHLDHLDGGHGAILAPHRLSDHRGHAFAFFASTDLSTHFFFDPNFGEFYINKNDTHLTMEMLFTGLYDAAGYPDKKYDSLLWLVYYKQ